jgi:hypothetical protein
LNRELEVVGLLVLVTLGIVAMILIARIASRSIRENPLPGSQVPKNGKEAVTLEKLAVYNTYELEGLINLLVEKGLISREELLKQVEDLKEQEREED